MPLRGCHGRGLPRVRLTDLVDRNARLKVQRSASRGGRSSLEPSTATHRAARASLGQPIQPEAGARGIYEPGPIRGAATTGVERAQRSGVLPGRTSTVRGGGDRQG